MWNPVLAISTSAAAGTLLRWQLGVGLNSFSPACRPALAANLIGGYIIGFTVACISPKRQISRRNGDCSPSPASAAGSPPFHFLGRSRHAAPGRSVDLGHGRDRHPCHRVFADDPGRHRLLAIAENLVRARHERLQITFFTRQDHRHKGQQIGDWLIQLVQELGLRGASLHAGGSFHRGGHAFGAVFRALGSTCRSAGGGHVGRSCAAVRRTQGGGRAPFLRRTPVEFGVLGVEPHDRDLGAIGAVARPGVDRLPAGDLASHRQCAVRNRRQ